MFSYLLYTLHQYTFRLKLSLSQADIIYGTIHEKGQLQRIHLQYIETTFKCQSCRHAHYSVTNLPRLGEVYSTDWNSNQSFSR